MHQCESLATAMSPGDVKESDRPKWNQKFVNSYLSKMMSYFDEAVHSDIKGVYK